jgi:hypothetical protein
LDGTYQLLVCTDYINLQGRNINTKKQKNKEAVSDTIKDAGNTEEIEYMFMSFHWNVGQNDNIKLANKLFEFVVKFR